MPIKIILTALLSCTLLHTFAQTNWRQKIDPAILINVSTAQNVMIILQAQADVSGAKQLRTKNEKGRFVFNALRQTASQSQKDIKNFLHNNNIQHQSFYIVNALQAKKVSAAMLQALAQRNDVRYISDDAIMQLQTPTQRLLTTQTRGPLAPEWGLLNIKADSVWALGFTGQNVVIGGADTGYDWIHPILQPHYRGYNTADNSVDHNYNWHDAVHSYSPLNADTLNPCGINLTAPCDDNSHGTHTMGTMVGDDNVGNQTGVAPGAKFICCRNMERGWGQPSTYTECFEWFLAPTDTNSINPDPDKAPHVINNSWYCAVNEGCDSPTPINIMEMAVENLRAAGIVVVVSNGNFGSQCETTSGPPAYFANSFAVGATDALDSIAGFSSRGMATTTTGERIIKPNVSAPGVNIRSSTPNGGYANYSGTSMAGPHVAGLVALLISSNPDLAGQVDTIESIIERSARPMTSSQSCSGVDGSSIPNNTFGFGIVNALAAVEAGRTYTNTLQPYQLDVQVYPNPVFDKLFVEYHDTPTGQFTLFNATGQAVMQEAITQNRMLLVTHLPKGIYFYQLQTANGIATGKMIKG